jgi:hypothetical protein
VSATGGTTCSQTSANRTFEFTAARKLPRLANCAFMKMVMPSRVAGLSICCPDTCLEFSGKSQKALLKLMFRPGCNPGTYQIPFSNITGNQAAQNIRYFLVTK